MTAEGHLFTHELSIDNPTPNPLRVWLEPWCEEVVIPVGRSIQLRAEGSEDGKIELEQHDQSVVVFGWPSSRLEIFFDGRLIWESYANVPPIPNGSIKGFIKGLFWQSSQPPA